MKKKVEVNDLAKLSNLRVGNVAIIKKVDYKNLLIRRRLFEMGLTTGVQVEVKKIAPFGDPVVIKIRGYELCLRIAILKNIEVRVLK